MPVSDVYLHNGGTLHHIPPMAGPHMKSPERSPPTAHTPIAAVSLPGIGSLLQTEKPSPSVVGPAAPETKGMIDKHAATSFGFRQSGPITPPLVSPSGQPDVARQGAQPPAGIKDRPHMSPISPHAYGPFPHPNTSPMVYGPGPVACPPTAPVPMMPCCPPGHYGPGPGLGGPLGPPLGAGVHMVPPLLAGPFYPVPPVLPDEHAMHMPVGESPRTYASPGARMSPSAYYEPEYGVPWKYTDANTTSGLLSQDIKRRTKTGCLTCRRRRIKCDEQRPSCKNCCKSNRICLGYDSVFATEIAAELHDMCARRKTFRMHQHRRKKSLRSRRDQSAMKVGTLVAASPEPVLEDDDTLSVAQPRNVQNWIEVVDLFLETVARPLDAVLGVSRFDGIAHTILRKLAQGRSAPRRFCKVAGELAAIRQLLTITIGDVAGLHELDLTTYSLEKLRETDEYCTLRALIECFVQSQAPPRPSARVDELTMHQLTVLHSLLHSRHVRSEKPVDPSLVDKLQVALDSKLIWKLASEVACGKQVDSQQFDKIFNAAKAASAIPIQVLTLLCLCIGTVCDRELAREKLLEINLTADPLSRALIEIGLDR